MANTSNFINYYYSLNFSRPFEALTSSDSLISKQRFFQLVMQENYLPVRLRSGNKTYYKLFPADQYEDDNHLLTIKDLASKAYKYEQMKGSPIPNFMFTDLDGNVYSEANTKGKVVAIKLWFIRCSRCIQEMPAFNQLVAKHNPGKVQFLSLAFDKGKDLKDFLKKRQLDCPVIPEKEKYVMDELGISEFPTYIVLNKNGTIAVVGDFDAMVDAIDRELL
jgi:peroxiredoxin